MTPQAAEGFSTLRLTLPDHLLKSHAAHRGLVLPYGPEDNAHLTLLYGLPGDTHLQEEVRCRIAELLRWHRVLSVDVTAPVLFVTPQVHSLAFMVFAQHLEDLRTELLAAFPEAQDPYRHGDWIPHVTLARLQPGTSW